MKKFPTLSANRLYRMVRERGCQGGPDHFRHAVSLHRPRPSREAYLRLRTLPGEQGQVSFHAALDLDAAAFAEVQARVRARVLRTFVKRGLIDQDDASEMRAWAHDAASR